MRSFLVKEIQREERDLEIQRKLAKMESGIFTG